MGHVVYVILCKVVVSVEEIVVEKGCERVCEMVLVLCAQVVEVVLECGSPSAMPASTILNQ